MFPLLFEDFDAFADRRNGSFEVFDGEGSVFVGRGLLGEFEGEGEFVVGFGDDWVGGLVNVDFELEGSREILNGGIK